MVILQSQTEHSDATRQVTWSAEARLSRHRKHHLVVVAPTEVIVFVAASIDPNTALVLQSSGKEA